MKKKLLLMMLTLVGSVGVCKGQVPDGFYQFLGRWCSDSLVQENCPYKGVWRWIDGDGRTWTYCQAHNNSPAELYRVFFPVDWVAQCDIALYGNQEFTEEMTHFEIWLTGHYHDLLHTLEEGEEMDSTYDAINIYNVSKSGFHVKWINPNAREWFSNDTIPESVWMEEYWKKVRPSYEALILRNAILSQICSSSDLKYEAEKGQTLKGWWKYKEFAYIDRDGKAVVQPQEEGKYYKYFDDDFQINFIETGRAYPEWQYEGYIKPIEYVSKEGNVELVKEANNLSLFRLEGKQCKLTYYSNNGFIVHELWERP